ncbi:MAG: hypothetical protein ABL927_00050 [Bdellovibrionales bacterium]
MKKIFQLISITILTITAAMGCGRMDSRSADKKATRLIVQDLQKQRAAIIKEITIAGVPSKNWSELDLNIFDQKMKKFSKIDALLAKYGEPTILADDSELMLKLNAELFKARESANP